MNYGNKAGVPARPLMSRALSFAAIVITLFLSACGGSKQDTATPYLWNSNIVNSETVPNEFISTYTQEGDLISIHKQSYLKDYWLQRHDKQGNLLWQQSFVTDPTSQLLYTPGDSGDDRINLLSASVNTDITWRAFDGNGQLLSTQIIPVTQRPEGSITRAVALGTSRLAMVFAGKLGQQASPIEVYEWTPSDFVLRFRSTIPAVDAFPALDADGNLLIVGKNLVGSDSKEHPDIAIKLDSQLEEMWVSTFQNDDAYFSNSSMPSHLLASGDLLINETLLNGGYRVRIVDGMTGNTTLRNPGNVYAAFVGAREDGGYYLAFQDRSWSAEEGSYVNSTRIKAFTSEGSELSYFDLPTDKTFFPQVTFDPAFGFHSYRLTSWTLNDYKNDNTKEAMQAIIELYDTTGNLTKTIKGKQAHWGALNGSPMINHQIGERFGSIRIQDNGQVFTTVTSLSPLGGNNNLVQFRAYE